MLPSRSQLCVGFLLAVAASSVPSDKAHGEGFTARAVKIDITPDEPVRLSGYGNRDRPSEQIDTRLFVRCLAISGEDGAPHLLYSVDTIGLDGRLTSEIASELAQRHGLAREHIVFCSTHSHTAPQLANGLDNIFTVPLTESEAEASVRYTQKLRAALLDAAAQSLADPSPATIEWGQTSVGFAANRRVIRDDRWTGFGTQADGPVDHSLPFFVVRGEDGSVLAVAFNYACHCTTLTGNDYGVSGDWAGFACQSLEEAYPDSVALCTIGCGGDQNPEPRGNLALARQHGEALAARVSEAIGGQLTQLQPQLTSGFDYAALTFQLPTIEEVERNKTSADPQTRRLAERLADTYRREGRLPATYPVPVQVWKIGKLQMIFLGGEVVVDYALRLKRELSDQSLWVTAYANDVLGYIASDRVRREGGYEVDRSAVYYGLPGPWAEGTEDRLIEKVKSLIGQNTTAGPLEPADALKSFDYPDDLELELVAAEPLIADPINIAFGPDGRLWVVEMGDYPSGKPAGAAATSHPLPEAMRGSGRIKALFDDDGNGRMDRAEPFLEGVSFATGVHPWRDGLIVAAAPWVFFAADRDGDGRCDEVRPLIEGLKLSNPQHRINGFTYGLDHSLHCAAGDDLGEVIVSGSGQPLNAAGSDLQLWPDSGEVCAVPGRSQFIRSRDDWGNWFGSDNSRPLYHYVLGRCGRKVFAPGFDLSPQQVFDPPTAPPVHPLSESDERFNDIFATDRFTSACSAIIVRSDAVGASRRGGVVVCEPVHNLVHYSNLVPTGVSVRAERPAEFRESELLRSSDSWFRPVRVTDAPDDALWIVDMYRRVIEHPEWIPAAWQERLDLRAGEQRGRIYRLARKSSQPNADNTWKSVQASTAAELVQLLCSPNGTLRDMAQQELLHRDRPLDDDAIRSLLSGHGPYATVHAMAVLRGMKRLTSEDLATALADDDPGVLQYGLEIAADAADLLVATERIVSLLEHPSPAVVLRAIQASHRCEHEELGRRLTAVAAKEDVDRWIAASLALAAEHHGEAMLSSLLQDEHHWAHATEPPVDPALFAALCERWRAAGRKMDRDWFQAVGRLPRSDALIAAALKVHQKNPLPTEPPGLFDEVRRTIGKRALEVLEDPSVEPAVKVKTLESARSIVPDDTRLAEAVLNLLIGEQPVDVQLAAVRTLRELKGDSFLKVALAQWEQLSTEARAACVSAAAGRASMSGQLLDAIESGAVDRRDVPVTVGFQLRSSGPRSNQVRAQRIFADELLDRDEAVLRYLASMPRDAEPERGTELFTKHCATCHLPDPSGRIVGVSLSNLSNYSDENLAVAILDPNRAVDPKYRARIVRTSDGEILTGVIDQENADGLTIAAVDGTRRSLRREEVEEIKDTGMSLMPSNFAEVLPPEDLRHVIEHLKRLAVSR